MISGRALHFVFKIGDRGANANFFRQVLGMKVLRHEEFKEGCEAQCNGPYENRWSKTMIGYGPESSHFVMELTYNYGVKSYDLGNDFHGITIQSKEIADRIKKSDYKFDVDNNVYTLKSPDGYQFFIVDDDAEGLDPIKKVTMNTNDLDKTQHYWQEILKMKVVSKTDLELALAYDVTHTQLTFKKIDESIDRKTAFGRIAFAVPHDTQPEINQLILNNKQPILTPLISLATPGKANVRVIILADPNGLEICFVDEEGFSQLSEVDPEGEAELDKYIRLDPYQKS